MIQTLIRLPTTREGAEIIIVAPTDEGRWELQGVNRARGHGWCIGVLPTLELAHEAAARHAAAEGGR